VARAEFCETPMSVKAAVGQGRGKKQVATRSPSFVCGQPGLYTKFLELCSEQYDAGLNVFSSGEARDLIAKSINDTWPGCTPEKIRIKLRQKPVVEDLEKRDILKPGTTIAIRLSLKI
jgi:hypothetical protein